MARLRHVFEQVGSTEVFSKRRERFVITDDWVIEQASTSTMLSLLRRLGAEGVDGGYEELDVEIS